MPLICPLTVDCVVDSADDVLLFIQIVENDIIKVHYAIKKKEVIKSLNIMYFWYRILFKTE